MNEKSYKNILIYDVSYKTRFGTKPLCIMFNKVDGFLWDYDEISYLVLLGIEKHDAIYDRIRYLICLKSDVTYVFSHNYAKINMDSDDDLPLEEILALYKVVIITH